MNDTFFSVKKTNTSSAKKICGGGAAKKRAKSKAFFAAVYYHCGRIQGVPAGKGGKQMRKLKFGRMPKTGIIAAAAVTAVLFGGCGKTSNNLGGATDWYQDSVYGAGVDGAGTYNGNGKVYWDGYGINGGRDMTGNVSNGFSGTANDSVGNATASALD